jgi:hypothetical protein
VETSTASDGVGNTDANDMDAMDGAFGEIKTRDAGKAGKSDGARLNCTETASDRVECPKAWSDGHSFLDKL